MTLRNAIALLALCLCRTGAASALPEPSSAPVDAACANPRLPPEILQGPFPAARDSLRVVTVRGLAVPLRLAVAADSEDRELGLMCVTRLRARHGMLFAFAQSGDWSFWMKNTLVPLDMIWVAADGIVTSVAANVPAATRTTPDAAVARRSGGGLYTLELNAGEAALDGLSVGTHLRFPPLHASR